MAENKILIVVDAQEDFTRGALRNDDAIAKLPVIHEIVHYAVNHEFAAIIYTQDTHGNDYLQTQEGKNLPIVHCVDGSDGWKLCPEVVVDNASAQKTTIFTVKKPSFGYTGWKNVIETPDEIWMCGFCTDICVSANFQILKAEYPEKKIVVISDASAGVTPELHEAALKVMKSCQADVKPWEELKSPLPV